MGNSRRLLALELGFLMEVRLRCRLERRCSDHCVKDTPCWHHVLGKECWCQAAWMKNIRCLCHVRSVDKRNQQRTLQIRLPRTTCITFPWLLSIHYHENL